MTQAPTRAQVIDQIARCDISKATKKELKPLADLALSLGLIDATGDNKQDLKEAVYFAQCEIAEQTSRPIRRPAPPNGGAFFLAHDPRLNSSKVPYIY